MSNLGNVRRLTKYVNSKNNSKRIVKEKILKTAIVYNGYKRVCLSKNSKMKCFRVNRLVAEAFIPNEYNLPQVNHKDENKLNNCVDNLEWCDAKYNINYGNRNKKVSDKLKRRIA